jgi:ribosomal-protein-serine acetyltransferase
VFQRRVDPDVELRLLEERDAAALHALTESNRAHLRRWLPWVDAVGSVEDTRGFVRGALGRHARADGFQAGIWYRGELVGVIGFHRIGWANRATEIGYWLDAATQGRGVMTRACRAMVDHAFGELGLHRVEIRCAPGNTRSCAIPERLGFTREGVLRQAEWLYDRFVDSVVYGLLEDEWRTGSAGRP